MNRQPGHDSDEGFVSRWSRRKSSARRAESSEQASEAPPRDQRLANDPVDPTLNHALEPGDAAGQNSVAVAPGNIEIPADTAGDADETNDNATAGNTTTEQDEPPDLPDIDSLTEQSDYSAFMAPNVSHEIRNLALRKLFRSEVFNIRDGLDDYDEDFTTFEKLGNIVTADMRHHAQRKQALAEQEQLAQEVDANPGDDADGNNHDERDDETTASTEQQADAAEPLAAGPVQDESVNSNLFVKNPGTDPGPNAIPAPGEQPVLTGKLRRQNTPPDSTA